MDGTAKRGSDQHPESAGEIAELCCENRANERAGTRNRSKVMAENHPAVRRDEILPVGMPHRCSASLIIKREDFRKQPCGMEAVGQCKRATSCHDQPEGIHWFIPDKRDRGNRDEQQESDERPCKLGEQG